MGNSQVFPADRLTTIAGAIPTRYHHLKMWVSPSSTADNNQVAVSTIGAPQTFDEDSVTSSLARFPVLLRVEATSDVAVRQIMYNVNYGIEGVWRVG